MVQYYAAPGLRRVLPIIPDSQKAKNIMEVVCRHFDISLDDVKRRRRFRNIVISRQLCFYFMRIYTKLSLKEIGELFYTCDHTTVIHGVRTIKDLMSVDKKFEQEVELLKSKL